MSVAEILTKADDNADQQLSYVEVSRWISQSAKHRPVRYRAADQDQNGGLDLAELTKFMKSVKWWKYSRQPRRVK